MTDTDGTETPQGGLGKNVNDEGPSGAGDLFELKRANENLERLASFDTLTGLPNRRPFRERLEYGLSVMRRHGTDLAVLYLDLDNFKRVNDSLGHDVGDILLREVAKRLCKCVREEDTVARLGGDEFVILVQTPRNSFFAGNLANRLLGSVKAPIMAANHEVVVTSSIGITLAPLDSSDPTTLLRNADLAMYRSKARGRDGYEFFESGMNLEASRRLSDVLARAFLSGTGEAIFLEVSPGFGFQVCPKMHSGGVEPQHEGFVGLLGAFDEIDGLGGKLVIRRLHPLAGQRPLSSHCCLSIAPKRGSPTLGWSGSPIR